MNFPSQHKPLRLNLDKSPKYLGADESSYLLNHEVNNPDAINKATPIFANYEACEMDLPSGENYSAGSFYSKLTNETYSWTINSNGVNFIQRINGDGECQVVWAGNENCLPLSADPKHAIKDWRAYMKYDKICANRHGKQLIWVDGSDNPIGMIDVEASIATNFFTTPFFDLCADECAPLRMCVPEPKGCLVAEVVPFRDEDLGKSNGLADQAFKFMIRYVYYDQRKSEWSDWSSLYYQDENSCYFGNDGVPRCLKLRIPIGNPMVDKIEFAVSYDGGATWFLYDTIDKYKSYNNTQQYWYERSLTEEIQESFNEDDCSFDYYFCNNKSKIAIDALSISRVFNPMPRAVQALLPIKNSLGFVNYIKGNCPLDNSEVNKFEINLNQQSSSGCDTEFAKVTVRALIYCPGGYVYPFGSIFRVGGPKGYVEDLTDTARFGISGYTNNSQSFIGETRNFIAYIEGTDYWGEMEQWVVGANFIGPKKTGTRSGGPTPIDIANIVILDQYIKSGYYYQEYVFNVPKGTRGIIRLVSNQQISGAGDNQNTSTQVIGTLGGNGLKTLSSSSQLPNILDTPKEIYFDTCNGDVEDFNAFVIGDFIPKSTSLIYSGYVTTNTGVPVEGAKIYFNNNFATYTDHNGFYSYGSELTSLNINVYVEQGCTGNFTQIESVGSFPERTDDIANGGTRIEIQSEVYSNERYFALVNVAVKDCDNNPVAGVKIAFSGSKYKVTDRDGIAHFKVRNYSSRNRVAIVYAMDNNGCFALACDNTCNPCLPMEQRSLAACFENTPTYDIVFASKLNTNKVTVGSRGLKHGGRYSIGWIAEGDCGRVSSVNTVENNNGYFDIPRVQDLGTSIFTGFSFNANGINLPSWVSRIKIVRSANLNPYTLQWLVDDIDRSVNGKIILTIQSLNDYNALYNFKTNTIYKYLQGDRVEFIQNGDGVIFNSIPDGVLSYQVLNPFNEETLSGEQTDVDYFNQLLILDDGRLDNLKRGAKIEIQHPFAINDSPAFFEICTTIPVTNGEVEIQTGTFETFDTYLVKRKIGNFPIQVFESKTPSDFFGGTAIDDTGKVHFINKYENEKRYGRNISTNSATQFNYFWNSEKTLDAALQGDVIAISLKDDKIGLAICENDNFLFQISDQLLRVGSDNVIYAAPVDNVISNPEAKISGEYGCGYDDIGSVFFGDGYATYIDSKHDVYVIHNYSSAKIAGVIVAKDGATYSTCSSFFKNRIREKSALNAVATNDFDKYRFVTGINKNTNVVYLTLKTLRHAGINNEQKVYAAKNDTIMYNPFNDEFLGFASFTPEEYSQLSLSNNTGCAFVTFQNSVPFIHPAKSDRYNEFFGVQCDWLFSCCINSGENKVKIPLSIELQSDTKFFVSSVTTDKQGFFSEIPARRWLFANSKFNAAFLNDANSRGGLYNGIPARGYFINVLFVRDNTIEDQYGTIDNEKRIKYSEIDNILFKFMESSASGMTENL